MFFLNSTASRSALPINPENYVVYVADEFWIKFEGLVGSKYSVWIIHVDAWNTRHYIG